MCSTVPSPNNNSQRPLRISGDHRHSQFLFCRLRVGHASTVQTGTHTAFSVKSQPKPSRLTTTSTTVTTIYSSCSRTSTLRQPDSLAYLKLMYYAQPLDVSRFHRNIALHLILSHHLMMLFSNPCSEVWCHSFATAARWSSNPHRALWKGTHTPNCSPCGQTVRLQSDNCRHFVLHHSRTVRFERLQSQPTTNLFHCLCVLDGCCTG